MARWLITGAGGQFGSVLLRALVRDGQDAVGTLSFHGPSPMVGTFTRMDLGDADAIAEVVRKNRPSMIVHAGAITSIQAAYEDPERTRRVNVAATTALMELAEECRARLVFTSTDLVFDGSAAPYVEDAPPSPLSIYGRSKAEAEGIVRSYAHGVVVRLALMYGLAAVDRPTTFHSQLDALRNGRTLSLFLDEYRTPIWLEDAALAARRIAESDYAGILHVAGPQRLSRLEMGWIAARAMGVSGECIVATRQSEMQTPELRPADVSLSCERFITHFGQAPGRPMAEAMAEIVTNG